jgi:DNA polymerase III subunit delta'
MRLSDIFGQDAAIGALRRALEAETLSGAYLFIGQNGVGKGALARAFAQAAACLSPHHHPFDSCGECESCRRIAAGTHPEIVTVAPAGESLQIWQFWTREAKAQRGILSDTLNYAPLLGRRRIYLIEQAETLTESAANSLLKVLEEPPPYVVFVLQAPHPARVLPTIVSRSQMVRLRSVPTAELSQFLQTRHGVEPLRAGMLAAYAEGRIGQAVQMAQVAAVGEEIGRVLDFAETVAQSPRVRALRLAEQLRKQAAQIKALAGNVADAPDSGGGEDESGSSAKEKVGRRQYAAVLDVLTAFYRDILALRIGGQVASIINRDRADRLLRISGLQEPAHWMDCLDALMIARRRLNANANIALVTEILAMSLTGYNSRKS